MASSYQVVLIHRVGIVRGTGLLQSLAELLAVEKEINFLGRVTLLSEFAREHGDVRELTAAS